MKLRVQMYTKGKSKLFALIVCCALAAVSFNAASEDIDIFVANPTGKGGNPNLLIILDNTTNWVGQNQHWPNKDSQGNYEVLAIKDIIDVTNYDINIGLMMYPFKGGGADGGFIRQAVLPMNNTVTSSNFNNSAFRNRLDALSNHISGSSSEAAASNRANGTLMFDAFKYFGGYTSPAHTGDNVAGSPTDSTHYGTTPFANTKNVDAGYADLPVIPLQALRPSHPQAPITVARRTTLSISAMAFQVEWTTPICSRTWVVIHPCCLDP